MEIAGGVFYVGDKQVGGCYEWKTDIKLVSKEKDNWLEYKTINRSIKTSKWWLFENTEAFTAKLYWVKGEHLVLADEKEVNRARYCQEIELGKEQKHELLMKF